MAKIRCSPYLLILNGIESIAVKASGVPSSGIKLILNGIESALFNNIRNLCSCFVNPQWN